MKELASKISTTLKTKGPLEVALKGLGKLGLDFRVYTKMTKHKRLMSQRVLEAYDYTVQAGPFAGMRISKNMFWTTEDHGTKILGYYEQEVQEKLVALQKTSRKKLFIDIGAADGFYAVGVLVNGLFDQAYAFEMSQKGQGVIRENAELNHCADRITTTGVATQNFPEELEAAGIDLSDAVILMDIEGAEFDLLTEENLEKLSKTTMIIEIHDFSEKQQVAYAKLLRLATKHFDLENFRTGARDASKAAILKDYSDHERWLFMSEGRERLMEWLVLTPK